MAKRSLSAQEMIDILEDIARNGANGAARIAAIKTLREIEASDQEPAGEFADLYAVDNPGRLKVKKAS
jgi:hypothetical protein